MKAYANKTFLIGILFTLLIAIGSTLLVKLPVLKNVGALAIAIIFAVIYRHFWGYPEKYRMGIEFSAKKLLRLAIILYGLKLNIHTIMNKGTHLLLVDCGVILFSIFFILFLNKFAKGDQNLVLLLGIGTGICGAAAIAAVSPILKSKEQDAAISVGIIALVGTVFSLVYTTIFSIFHLDSITYGIWSGISLQEIAHVVLAASAGGENALAIGLLAKLGRVFLLIPVSIILLLLVNRKNKNDATKAKIEIPYFLLGFLGMSILSTFIAIPKSILNEINSFTSIILIMAMVGLGLNVSFTDLKQRALKPLLLMITTSITLSILTIGIAYLIS